MSHNKNSRPNKRYCRGHFRRNARYHKFLVKKHKGANHFNSQKLHSALILRLQQRRTNMSGILQYLHNDRTNFKSESEVELVTVPSSIKCYITLYKRQICLTRECV